MAEPKPVTPVTSSSGAADATAQVTRRQINPANLLVAALTLVAGLWGAWWLYDRLTNVYILDARISADMLLLSSRVPGWVVEVPVSESQFVHAGDALIRIDDRSAAAHVRDLEAGVKVLDSAMDALRARLTLVERRTASHIDAAAARLDAALSEQAASEGDLEIAEAEWKRAGPLRERNLLSQQEFEADRNEYRNASQAAHRRRAEVASARADLAEAESEEAEIAVLEADLLRLHSEREQALQKLEQAVTELDYHTVSALSDGVIDELFIDPGEHAAAGQRVLIMHNPNRIWVKANVKETDLSYVVPGAKVQIVVDAYPETVREGIVKRVGAAATSQFALLPNPNPSGNFTKVTQRVETTIELAEHDPRLKPGMMVEVKIPRSP